jgi:4-hydroxy-2-oxoheptanedioate aldolase
MTNLRERLSGGTTAFGGWCTMGSSFGAELLGSSGFDYVCVDLQHGLSDFELGWQLVQALRGTGASPIVRVPFNHTPWPGKAFDAGAEAVVVPMVNSRADAEAAVAACRYAPEGVRSFGPVRSGLVLGDDPVAVNRTVLCLVMIESVRAVEAADAICSTPGVDGVYIGPADLSVSMCGSLAAMGSAEHAGAIETVRHACARNGVTAGIHTGGGAQARAYADAGFAMCTIATDAALLRSVARAELEIARGAAGGAAPSSAGPYG